LAKRVTGDGAVGKRNVRNIIAAVVSARRKRKNIDVKIVADFKVKNDLSTWRDRVGFWK